MNGGRPSAGERTGIRFWKMTAAGNDFLVLHAGSLPVGRDRAPFVRQVCRRGTSAGADGVVLVERLASDRLKVQFFNPDGRETFCANGARCASRFGVLAFDAEDRLWLQTVHGTLRSEVAGERVRLQMDPCGLLRPEFHLPLEGAQIRATLLAVGVPHLVTFDLDPETVDVPALGRALRNHPLLEPDGANVNFVRIEKRGELSLRTYERGVEGETLSCGTGCVAAALAAALRGEGASPTTCHTRSGSALVVRYRDPGEPFRGVFIEGEARVVYTACLW